MNVLRRLTIGLLVGLPCLVVVALLYYVMVVHPDDERIEFPSVNELQPLPRHFDVAGAMMVDKWDMSAAFFQDEFDAARKLFSRTNAGTTINSSPRFRGQKSIYTTTGEYPGRLEGRDGVFLPDGDTLRVWPDLAGEHWLRFAAYADSNAAQVVARYGDQTVAVKELTQAVDVPPERGWLYRQFGRFMWPDRSRDMRRWHVVTARVVLEPDRPLALTCRGARHGCVVSSLRALKSTAAPKRRNVLMVLVDTMRGDAVPGAKELARVAAGGTSFSNALSPGNMTSPSTNALLACRKAATLGSVAFAYAVDKKARDQYYRKRKPSFPAAFQRAGYATAMIGNVSVLSEIYNVGVNHGFEEQIAIEIDAYDTPLIAREAVNWLGARGDEPFFLYVHLHGPHAPYRAPLRDILDTYPGVKSFGGYPSILRWLYQSEIHYTDRYLARMLAALDKLGLAGNTDVVVTADHGDMHTVRRFEGNEAGPSFAGAYFDHGATLLNDEVRVPMIFRGAGIKAGQVVGQYMSTLDIGPTLLDRAGLEVPPYCEGQSLKDVLAGNAAAGVRTVGSEAFQGRAIIMDGQYKYIRMYAPVDKRVYAEDSYQGPKHLYFRRHQLYDLRVDPAEHVDLSASQPELLAKAEAAYAEFYAIKPIFELIVDAMAEGPVDVRIPNGVKATVSTGKLKAFKLPMTALYGDGPIRAVVELRGELTALPIVHVGPDVVPLMMTTMDLPLPVDPATLPLESGGAQTLLPVRDQPAAYLRRIADDGQKDRRISVGNPAFDKILREWGYLND